MVGTDYMTAHKARPSAVKQFIDQSLIPAAIDMAGGMEAGLERVAVATKAQPALVIGAALLIGGGLARLLLLALPKRRRWI